MIIITLSLILLLITINNKSMERTTKTNEGLNNEEDANKKLRILKNLKLTKENLSAEDIFPIVEKLNNSDFELTKETVERIFNELDADKRGYIKKDELADYIIIKSSKKEEDTEKNEYLSFIDRIVKEEMVSKPERIIEKLKRIKNKAWLAGDSESHEDIDWIISVIAEEDLFEPEYDTVKLNSSMNKNNGMDHIKNYSHIGEARRRESDILTIKDNNKSSNISLKSVVRPEPDHSNAPNRRRSTRMSTFVSPSLFGKILSHLENVAKIEFDIFDLNELVDRKTTFYIAYEIFSREQYFENMIDEDKFKNFVNEIIIGYNRNIPYHNDLHAGDVMQTLYHIIDRADLKTVII